MSQPSAESQNVCDAFWNAFMNFDRVITRRLFWSMLKENVNKNEIAVHMLININLIIYKADAPIVIDEEFVIHYMKIAFATGVDINYKDPIGNSVLFIAVNLNLFEIVRFLLSFPECDVNLLSGITHYTPLHTAASNRSIPMMQLLLSDTRCDIERLATTHRLSALFYCIRLDYRDFINYTEVISVLLKNGACMYSYRREKSAVSLALRHRNPRILEVLLRNGALAEHNAYPDFDFDSLIINATVFHKEQEQTAVAIITPHNSPANTRFETFLGLLNEGQTYLD